jgi:hypothetical protein
VHSALPLVPRPNSTPTSNPNPTLTHHITTLKQHKSLTRKERLLKTLMKIHFLPKSSLSSGLVGGGDGVKGSTSSDKIDLIDSSSITDHCKIDFPENVLKVYR